MLTAAAAFGLFTGVSIAGMWTMFFLSGKVPEVKTEPVRLAFHLAAEGLTALALVIAGIAILIGAGWGPEVYLIGSGMLLYTVVVSPGYFAQRGQAAPVGMFVALAAAALAFVVLVAGRTG